ncbi:hypothetical protein [Bacillus wiedmannii]|uniref:hypothetical protein n=1 Tax=Bacillus wiedmannii TaxID=1890302 RepID=UPI000BF38DFF|nr:hypothetical protein [Bacillus wiedmannii]PFZ86149.1 hypothetical protein COL83_28665 [Bacillus wiedmannii]
MLFKPMVKNKMTSEIKFEKKNKKVLFVLGVILTIFGGYIINNLSSPRLLQLVLSAIVGVFFICLGMILIIYPYVHVKILKYIYNVFWFPIAVIIYIGHLYQLIILVVGCIYVFLLFPNLLINSFYTTGNFTHNTKLGLIYLSLIIGLSLFVYIGQLIISKLFNRFLKSKLGQSFVLRVIQPYIMRVVAYIMLIIVYVFVNIETFMNVELIHWSIWKDLKVVFKEVLLTFVSIDTLVQVIISKYKKNN